ncbi:MAG: S8 family serine peptidase [Phycisphaerae bacterium]|nr:S8 family serine peptidase [Phycisphaerae bacterium]
MATSFAWAGSAANAEDARKAQEAASKRVTPIWGFTPDADRFAEPLTDQEIEARMMDEAADHEIVRARAKGRVSVLVYTERIQARGADVKAEVRQFAALKQARVKYEYSAVLPNVVNIRDLPADQIEALKQLPGVTKVELDQYHPNAIRLHDSVPLVRGLQSQISAAGLTADGAGIRICIVDTGIDSDHVMYSTRIDTAAGYDFYNDDSNPEDDNGHGSHVSGIAAGGTGLSVDFGCGAGSQAFQGMAPAATLIGAKVLNASGGGFDSDIIAGINYCADQSPSGGRADVINMSIGTGNYTGPCTHSWAVAANNAVANGVVAVAASGNENNSNSMGSPACGVDVIAVGATWKADYPTCEDSTSTWSWGICTDVSPQTDEVGCFSNESDYLDVTAPGLNIWSASNAAGGGSIVGQSGTSMASPHVAGLAALILSADPTLTPAEVRQVIRDGAIDMGTPGFDRAYGYGRIDVINSLNLLAPCMGDPDCDDGLWCNGAETCSGGSCFQGTPPCGGDPCDEATDSCVSLVYEWNLNTNPGWTMQGQWAYGQPTGGGGEHGGPDPTSGATGSNVLGYNLSGDYGANLPETHLTTTAINCTGLSGVTLRFERWLGVEQPTYDHAYVRVSTNGSSWTTIWENTAEIADSSWTQQEFDISSIADNQPTVYIRWTMGTTDGSWFYCGWNIDDIEIWAAGGGPQCVVPADCDDGLFCNGAEDCIGGSCVAGTPVDCDDGVSCTNDSCNEGTDSCDNVPNDGLCDDGQYCDGIETCHATLGCQTGTPVSCNDGVACTNDSCNEATDSCDYSPNDANCDDGQFCNGAETCNATLGCQAGGDPCPGQTCDELNDVCTECSTDPDCDDGLYCNGVETCSGAVCQAGTPVDCSDGVACTDDSCNEATDSCDNTPNDANCNDGLYCNGTETCSATLDCQAGTPVNCDDAVGCTDDSCNEGTDSCDHAPNHGLCDDGLFCNGAEVCSVSLDCQPGTAVDCDDGVGCTDDSCNEGTDSCDNVPNDANCPDDGLFCNGTEFCHVVNDCDSTGDPCGGLSCNEATDTCESVECTVPADCDDGNACTVDDCVGNVCVNECPGAVSTFPYAENFDASQGAWSNVGGDVFDWTRDAAGTPSSSTGPSGDHTTGSGYYMYIETSSPRVLGDYAILEGPCLDLTGTSTVDFSFWYHMYGATIGALDVEVSDDCTNWTNVWSLSGNQGNTWYQANISLDAYAGSTIRVRFIGTRGSSYTGDIAIDDIAVDASGMPCTSDPECDDGDACTVDACVGNVCQNAPISCDDGNDCTIDSCVGGVCVNECPVSVAAFPDAEDFEAGFGDWSNTISDDIDWTRNSGGTPSSGTGPSGDHTTGSGWYMYVEASSPNYPSMIAILDGPCVDLTGSTGASLSFWYHMLGSAVGTLSLEASEDCNSWTTLWSLSGDQGSLWQQANVDLSAYAGSVVSLRFRGVTGSSYQGDMCIDDLLIDASGGPECTIPADCDDGLYCNGAEDCAGGSCVAGTPVNCSDGVSCTDDSCNEGTDSCDHAPNDALCNNGQYCDGVETCHVTLGCQAGSPVTCDDGVGCTDDVCNEGTDSCDYVANDANCPDNGLFCDGSEYCDALSDCSSTGDPCTGGQTCNESTDTCEGPVGAQLEAGTVTVGGTPMTVNLANTYASPVIVCSINYRNNSTPVVTRISNVTSTSFDLRLQNPSGGAVSAESVSCLVVEEGIWTIDGVNIEAQIYTSTVTDENNSWVGQAQTCGQSYTSPVILGQVMSVLDPEWSVFWCRGNSQTNPPTATVLYTGKTVCEDTIVARANETIGFIVIESGHGTIGGVAYEAALGPDTVLGITNSPPYSYSFGTPFATVPSVAVVTMAAMDGGNGGWAYTYGSTSTTTTQLRLAIDEDQIADTERNHVNEQVGYIVFESALVYP